MTKDILSSISRGVRDSCDSTATDDISSAVGLYNYYCSAAQSLVVATGVTASVEQTYPVGVPVSGSRSGTGPQATGTSAGSTDGDKKAGGPSAAVIAGAIVGVVAVLAIIGVVVFFVRKNAQKRKQLQIASDQVPMTGRPSTSGPDYYNGKQELPADSIAGPSPASPSPSMLKVNNPPRSDTVSPISSHGGALSPHMNHAELNGHHPVPPMPYGAELPGKGSPYPPMPQGAELQGQAPAYAPSPNTAELYGQGATVQHPPRPELQGQGAMYPPPNGPGLQQGQGTPYPTPYRQELAGHYNYPPSQQVQVPSPQMQSYSPYGPAAAVSPASSYMQSPPPHPAGMSWQAGPVSMVHEMDGGHYNPPGQAR